jgi:peptide/nickel transport system ATP-binding protein
VTAAALATVPAMPLLDVADLSVEFVRDRTVARAVIGVSFSVDRGETLAVVGESGSGKSVTALALMRLLKTPPARISGRVLLEGRNVLEMTSGELRQIRGGQIAMVFQDALSSLNPVRTIGAQMEEALRLHLNLRGGAARRRAIDFLGRVGIPSPARQLGAYPHQFSGGMQQRVMIAMALSCEPRVLLADEPTTALDVSVQAQILELLRGVTSEFGTALVMISHDLSIVAGLADRVAVMYAGEIVETGSTEKIFERPQHPYTLGLLECVPRIDEPRVDVLPAIEGTPPDITDLPVGCFFASRCPFQMEHCLANHPRLETKREGQLAACWADLNSAEAAVGKVAVAARFVPSGMQGLPAPLSDVALEEQPLLETKAVSVDFRLARGIRVWQKRPTVRAVRDVSVEVRAGETLGLVGESGSGKSTLARAILRVAETSSGEIVFDGNNILQMPESEFRSLRPRLQMVFQDPYGSLNPRRTVWQTVAEPWQIHTDKSRSEIRHEVDSILDAVGLDGRFLRRRPQELSGGQRQRVSIARALALDPAVVIADESTSALDVSVRAQILNLLQALQAERGLTFVFISHDLSIVRHMSNRIAVMYLGRIVELADRDTLFENPAHPYTRALLSMVSIPDPAVERHRERRPIAGEIPSPASPPTGCHFHPRCPLAFDRCKVEAPPLYTIGEQHHSACFLSVPDEASDGDVHQIDSNPAPTSPRGAT